MRVHHKRRGEHLPLVDQIPRDVPGSRRRTPGAAHTRLPERARLSHCQEPRRTARTPPAATRAQAHTHVPQAVEQRRRPRLRALQVLERREAARPARRRFGQRQEERRASRSVRSSAEHDESRLLESSHATRPRRARRLCAKREAGRHRQARFRHRKQSKWTNTFFVLR